MIHEAVQGFIDEFSVADIVRKCPMVGIDMVRKILKDFQSKGIIECLGRGRNAKWRKTGN